MGLSLAFISNLVELSRAQHLYLLITAWILLVGSILAVLGGLRFATRQSTIDESRDYSKQMAGRGPYEEKGPDPKVAQKRMDKKNRTVSRFNAVSFWLFVVGLVLLVVFISINVLNLEPKPGGQTTQIETETFLENPSRNQAQDQP